MNDYAYKSLKNYLAQGQRVRVDIDLFTARQKSGIRNGLKQGFWLSAGKVSWLAEQLADEYKLPFVRYRQGSYACLYWNKEAGKLPGLKDALVALIAFDKMTNPKKEEFSWRQNSQENAIANTGKAGYMTLTAGAGPQVAGQLAKINAPASEALDKFLKDFDENNLWLSIS